MTYVRQRRLRMSVTFYFNVETHKDIRTSWKIMLKEECINFPRFDSADQLSFLFENLARSTAKFIAKCFSLRRSCLFKYLNELFNYCSRCVYISRDIS